MRFTPSKSSRGVEEVDFSVKSAVECCSCVFSLFSILFSGEWY